METVVREQCSVRDSWEVIFLCSGHFLVVKSLIKSVLSNLGIFCYINVLQDSFFLISPNEGLIFTHMC